MAEEIVYENGRISNFLGLMALTLDRIILHTIMHHSPTSTYKSNFTEIEETLCGRMNVDLRTKSRPKNTLYISNSLSVQSQVKASSVLSSHQIHYDN